MTNTSKSRNLFRTLFFSTVLAAITSPFAGTHAADGHPSGATNRGSGEGGTSITRELEKLFNESGQEMPSMRTQDLPYATTPQMNRVRRVETPTSTAPKKKKKASLFSKLFGRFRRDQGENEEITPEPPPIVLNDATRRQNNGNRQVSRPQVVQSPVSSQPRGNTSGQQARSNAVVQQQVVRREFEPAPFTDVADMAELPRLDPPVEDKSSQVVIPALAKTEDEFLDLDAVAVIPEIPEATLFDSSKELETVVEDIVESEPEANPFTGVQLVESDGFVSPFEEAETGDVEPEQANPFMVSTVAESVERASKSVSIVSSSREALGNGVSASFDEFVAADGELVPAESEKAPTRDEMMASRKGQAGFLGFCPVALRDRQELVDSDEKYKARFGLKTYHFGSAAAVQAFQKNPTHYAPVAGGADVVALVNAGEELPGSIRYAMWYQERLYLFQSQETKDLFCAAPADFADQY